MSRPEPSPPPQRPVAPPDALPVRSAVGPVTARRTLEWRACNGRSDLVEQLRERIGV